MEEAFAYVNNLETHHQNYQTQEDRENAAAKIPELKKSCAGNPCSGTEQAAARRGPRPPVRFVKSAERYSIRILDKSGSSAYRTVGLQIVLD